MFKEILREYIEFKGLSQSEIAEIIGDSQQAVSDFLNKSGNPQKKTREKYFEKLVGFKDYYNTKTSNKLVEVAESLMVNEPSQIYPTKAGSIIEELPNGKYLLTVPMVPYKAHATYISEFTDADFIQDLTKVSFIVDRVPRGKYQAFEIINDSMNDATLDRPPSRDAILSGDIVLGRELGRQHWLSKLNINGYPYWIIVTHHNIICKEIVHHDIEKGIITCHSLNSSPEFQDFDLKLDECHQLFNIIKKQV